MPRTQVLPTTRQALGWLVVVAAFVLPLVFAFFTRHVWEDYYITLRTSRNLVEGHGLVFQPGERVHTFTSPLGVLIPALFLWTSGGSETVAMWLFRVVNAVLLAGSIALLVRRIGSSGHGTFAVALLIGFVLFDAKLTDFAINGQETALIAFFVVWLWSELERPGLPRVWVLAGSYAGLMWTRPDAFVLAGAITLPHLFWPTQRTDERTRRQLWPLLGKGAFFGALLYLPWFGWSWWYYGSPVPHTIIAKSIMVPPTTWPDMLLHPLRLLAGSTTADHMLLPTYFSMGGWPARLWDWAHLLLAVAAFGWLFPQLPAIGRRASLAVFMGALYLSLIPAYPWYYPPWTILAAIALTVAADVARGAATQAGRPHLASAVRVVAMVAVGLQLAILLASGWQFRVQQRVIESEGRQAIGEWLRQHAHPKDTVFLEPLGYIGYFSRLKTFDFPGLSSPEVVAAIRARSARYAEIIQTLEPTWMVLRPEELRKQQLTVNGQIPDYEFVRAWSARPALDRRPILPGRPYLEYDAVFLLFHRRTEQAPGGGGSPALP